jgi:hypothetical protein
MDLINRRNFKMRKFEFVKRMGENGLKLPERSTAKSARI